MIDSVDLSEKLPPAVEANLRVTLAESRKRGGMRFILPISQPAVRCRDRPHALIHVARDEIVNDRLQRTWRCDPLVEVTIGSAERRGAL